MTERRIRNTTEDVLEVPLLGVRLEPGDVATIPDSFPADVVFPETHFEVDGPNDGGTSEQDAQVPAADVREIHVSDSATVHEGVNE